MPTHPAPIKVVKLDAAGQSFGRLSSQAVYYLRGKHLAAFAPNITPSVKVVVTNLSLVKFTGRKLTDKIYYRFSGYPGGVKKVSLQERFSREPERLFRASVKYMLPKNRLSEKLIKNLQIYLHEEK